MRTLQEKYNGIQEGKFSKDQFLRDTRMEFPNLVTQYNGYDDAVQILKNRGMIQEAVKTKLDEVYIKFIPGRVYASKNGKLTYIGVVPPGGSHKGQKNPTQENLYLFADESGKQGFGFNIEQLKQARMDPMSTRGDFGNLPDANIVTLDGTQGLLDMIANATVKRTVSGPELNEARLTKNNLTDYRYKPTNEMDKYPYEQILRGLRVELEVAGVLGTPTAEEYAKALAKVSKNLAKDSIFYTNQLAGVNPKVDLHDKMVDATAKNTVDTFNGMKKAELKEGFKKLIKKVLSEEVIDVEDYNGEDEFDMYGDDEADDIPHPRGYEDQDEIDYDDENFSDPFIDDPDFQFEATDTEADKDMVRKLMTMYETEPSKFERLHKQAQTQASTSKDVKYKHLLSLIDRAKAGALQSLSNQDRAQADSEGMDENLYEARKAKPLSELLK